MIDVFEEQARDGYHLQIIDARWFLGYLTTESCVLALKCPRDKCCKSAGLVLHVPDPLQMPHTMFYLIADAEHHRRSGPETDVMSGPHDVQPLLRIAFRRDSRTH